MGPVALCLSDSPLSLMLSDSLAWRSERLSALVPVAGQGSRGSKPRCVRAGSHSYSCEFVKGEVGTVKLAEALAERAEATRRVEQLRARVVSSARYQEGETPAEDAAQLLAEAGEVLESLETLIRRINRTNATVEMGSDGTLTDALARRDVLRLRHSVVTAAAEAAVGKGERGYARQLRSELMMLSALPVAELRGQADALAREIREVDMRIQRTNWEVDLLD